MLSSLGIGSGLDSSSLVEQLVTAERQGPAQRLDRSEGRLDAELSAFGVFQSRLDALEKTVSTFDGLTGQRRVDVSNSSILSASISGEADIADYRVEVSQLASAQSVASAGFVATDTTVGSGTLNIAVGGAAATAVEIDPAAATLADVRDAINGADAGVDAAIVDDGTAQRLVIAADDTGAANTIDISVTDNDGNNTDTVGLSALSYTGGAENLAQVEAASDAALTVNGLDVTRPTNQIDDLLPGLSLDLKQAQVGTVVEVSVASDTGAAKAAVEDFVEAYNGLQKPIAEATRFDAESGQAGVLLGDSTARGLLSSLRNGVVADTGVSGPLDRLVDLGISTDEDGGLEIDDARLNEALADDFEGVAALLGGIGETFGRTAARFGGDDGIVAARSEGVEARLEDIGDQREALDRRIANLEERLRAEFSALDTLVAGLQDTGDFLSRQLSNLPTPGGGS